MQTDTRPVHALKPKNLRPLSPMETLCGVDPYKVGVRIHRPKNERSPAPSCRKCLAAIRAGTPHQHR